MKHEEMAHAGSPDTVRCVPVPDWVEHAPYLQQTPEAADAWIGNGICRLLQDTQVDLRGSAHAWHFRTAQRVLTRAGAEHAAHFVAEFDPTHERLDVHFIRVLRGHESIEHAKPGAIQSFRRETSLERLVLDGRLTASLLIPDVRVDDIVELGITLYRGNPVLGGKYAAWAVFDSFNPWLETRHRLLRPVEREIFIKEFNDPPVREIVEKDDVEDSRWRLAYQKQREGEELTPPWLVLRSALQCTEFRTWNDVARLFTPFYESPTVPDALAAEIDRLVAAHDDPAELAAEWLRLVQRRLRYFALALGEGGLVPRGLDAIWTTGFGDCKDAAQLYIAGARRMGLDACAALVSTTHGPALNDFLPSTAVFNHCIVRLRLNGVSYWLDPTSQAQGGTLANIFQPHAGWALPLAPESAELERLNSETPLHFLNCEDELRLGPKRESPAKLCRHIEYFFLAADSVRNRIANEGTTEYSKEMLNELRAAWPNIVETAPMEIRDDQVENCFTAIFNFEIRDCWKQANGRGLLGFDITDTVAVGELAQLRGIQRQTDIHLGRPRKITHRVRMDMPRKWAGAGWHNEHQAPGIRYSNRLNIDGRAINSSKELVIDAWSIPAEHASAYSETTGKLRENVLTIWARERFGKVRPTARARWGFTVWIIFVVLWAIFITVSRNLPPR